jgi:outer membrane cobalamin receptor
MEATHTAANGDSKASHLIEKSDRYFSQCKEKIAELKSLALLNYNYERRQKMGDFGRADAINNLSVGAEYELLNRINVFGRLNNLLNKAYATEAGYPVEGLHFMAGISCRF